MVNNAATEAHNTAPLKVVGSIESPKLKKNIAPKKSLKGKTSCSIRLMYWESASTNPAINAPIASATWMVSEKPATIKSSANITRTNSSDVLSWRTLSIAGTSLRPRMRKARMNPIASNEVPATVQNELLPVRISRERNEICMAINRSSNIIMPMMTSVSGLAVRFRSVSTLATIAVEVLVMIPQSTMTSLNGSPISQPISRPEQKLSTT